METTLYGIRLSHPVITARLALGHKGLPSEPKLLLGGLHPVPRRLIRRALSDSHAVRRWFADVATPLPLPGANAVVLAPVARLFARMADASPARTAGDRAALDELLDRVDALIAEGVIGAAEAPNAADFQIAPSVRMLAAFDSLRARVEGHPPAHALAFRLVPDYPDIPA